MSVLSDWQRGWLEAAIDGEGTICIARHIRAEYRYGEYYQPHVSIANTNRDFVECALMICGCGRVRSCVPHNKEVKESFIYAMPASAMRDILPKLSLIIKERQKNLILELLTIEVGHNTGRMITLDEIKRMREIYEEVSFLNIGKGRNSLVRRGLLC